MQDNRQDDFDMQLYRDLTAEHILFELERQREDILEEYGMSRLDHSLQAGTRAYRDGADVDWIVGTLLHDVGEALAPNNHDRFTAELIRPFVREEVAWVIEHHGLFQSAQSEHYSWDAGAKSRFKNNIYYQSCRDFCERWDIASFDPKYPAERLSFFAPNVKSVFSRKANDPGVIQPGVAMGLPVTKSPN